MHSPNSRGPSSSSSSSVSLLGPVLSAAPSHRTVVGGSVVDSRTSVEFAEKRGLLPVTPVERGVLRVTPAERGVLPVSPAERGLLRVSPAEKGLPTLDLTAAAAAAALVGMRSNAPWCRAMSRMRRSRAPAIPTLCSQIHSHWPPERPWPRERACIQRRRNYTAGVVLATLSQATLSPLRGKSSLGPRGMFRCSTASDQQETPGGRG